MKLRCGYPHTPQQLNLPFLFPLGIFWLFQEPHQIALKVIKAYKNYLHL